MSFSQFLAKTWINLVDDNPNIDYQTEKDSGIERIYTKHNVVTFFIKETTTKLHRASHHAISLLRKECIPDSNLGKSDNSKHSIRDVFLHPTWHHENDSYGEHYHLMKDVHYGVSDGLSENEMNCLIERIDILQKVNGLCLDGKKDCILTENDQEKLIHLYSERIKKINLALPHKNAMTEALAIEIQNSLQQGMQAFLHAFLMTLFKHYLKPYLISHGMKNRTADLWNNFANITTTGMINLSYYSIIMNQIMSNSIPVLLKSVGIDSSTLNDISSMIGTVIGFAKNPYSLLELSVNASAASAGMICAYQIIHCLPKIKLEPKEESKDNKEDKQIDKTRYYPKQRKKR